MEHKTFGAMVAAALASLLSGATSGCERKPSNSTGASESVNANEKLVKCYSRSCAGKFEYKGQMNKCGGMAYALEVPESVCNPNKGLKTINEG